MVQGDLAYIIRRKGLPSAPIMRLKWEALRVWRAPQETVLGNLMCNWNEALRGLREN